MEVQGFGAYTTDTALLRIELLLGEPSDEAWFYLFETARAPEVAELTDNYVAHGVDRTQNIGEAGSIYIDLKPEAPVGAVYYALDWLSNTAAEVDRQRLLLRDQTRKAVRRGAAVVREQHRSVALHVRGGRAHVLTG